MRRIQSERFEQFDRVVGHVLESVGDLDAVAGRSGGLHPPTLTGAERGSTDLGGGG
jgi:hypothetical protein